MQKNFKELTLKEIVAKTRLSKGAFYHFFDSKEQVFAEVIQQFFADMMNIDFTQLPQTSLKVFYNELLKNMEQRQIATERLVPKKSDGDFNNNFYYLIFGAMRMLPNFKAGHLQSEKDELKGWKTMINTAKKSKEIRTTMAGEQVAKLFI